MLICLLSVIDAGGSPEGTVLFGLRARLERLPDLVHCISSGISILPLVIPGLSNHPIVQFPLLVVGEVGLVFCFRATNSIFEVTLIHFDRDSFIAWHFKNDTLHT